MKRRKVGESGRSAAVEESTRKAATTHSSSHTSLSTMGDLACCIDAVLAEETLEEIERYLGLSDLASLAQCSSQWQHRIDSNLFLWKSIAAQRMNVALGAQSLCGSPRISSYSTSLHTHPHNDWKSVVRRVVLQEREGVPNLFGSTLSTNASSQLISLSPSSSPGTLCVHGHYNGSNQSNHAVRTTVPLFVPPPPPSPSHPSELHTEGHAKASPSPLLRLTTQSWITLESADGSNAASSDPPSSRAPLFSVVERSVRYFEVRLGCRALSEEEAELLQPLSVAPATRSTVKSIKKNRQKARRATQPGKIWEEECVAIGAATDNFPPNRQMPGWKYGSIGYHSDDGALFIDGQTQRRDMPQFGTGDVIGVGIYPNHRSMFYTLNGRFLCVAATQLSTLLFPTIGLDSDDDIVLNFGGAPFIFDLDTLDPIWNKKAENLLRFEGEQAYEYKAVDAAPTSALLRRWFQNLTAPFDSEEESVLSDMENGEVDDMVEVDSDMVDAEEDEESDLDHLAHPPPTFFNPHLARALLRHRHYQSDGEASGMDEDEDDDYSSDEHGKEPHSL
jgi:hypothetical protein